MAMGGCSLQRGPACFRSTTDIRNTLEVVTVHPLHTSHTCRVIRVDAAFPGLVKDAEAICGDLANPCSILVLHMTKGRKES
ncbi:unnamed protein product [Taenia asiatica]|uniref:Uncharacterized protein n=1 Tax=Taenia asiatica TaxID=60517 RepID=A0A0R3WAU2_TAEAS|nr:unnamed protein product [Taenia asiatica]